MIRSMYQHIKLKIIKMKRKFAYSWMFLERASQSNYFCTYGIIVKVS